MSTTYDIQINEHQRQILVRALVTAHNDEQFVQYHLNQPSDNGEPDALADATVLRDMLTDLPEHNAPGTLHGFTL